MPYPLLVHGRHGGATYQAFGEWMVPQHFGSLDEEYRTLRVGAGLIDYSSQAQVELRGADRAAFLHHLLTNDITRLAPGAGCRAALLTAAAKLVADLLVVADRDTHRLWCDAGRAAVVAETLERYRFSEQVSIANLERAQALLAVEGPAALQILDGLLGAPLPLPHAGTHTTVSLDGLPLSVMRHSLLGGTGVLCWCPAEDAPAVWALLRARGAPLGLRPVGWEALNVARIEAGVPWFGLDMDESNLLPETGLEAVTVSETKGCYLGQEIIARLVTYGSVSQKLVGLLLEGGSVPSPGDQILRDGEPVGRVTSACWSPSLNRLVGMGYVKRGTYESGTAVTVQCGGTAVAASVARRPLVKPA